VTGGVNTRRNAVSDDAFDILGEDDPYANLLERKENQLDTLLSEAFVDLMPVTIEDASDPDDVKEKVDHFAVERFGGTSGTAIVYHEAGMLKAKPPCNGIGFLTHYEGLSVEEARQYLAHRADPSWPAMLFPQVFDLSQEQARRQHDALTTAVTICQSAYLAAPTDLLRSLGINAEMETQLNPGLVPEDLWYQLAALGFTEQELMSTGFFTVPEQGEFSGTVILPYNEGQEAVYFVGVQKATDAAGQEVVQYQRPAYRHLRDRGFLYGTWSVVPNAPLWLVRDPLDAAAIIQTGRSALAIGEVNVTRKQLPTLWEVCRKASEIICVLKAETPDISTSVPGRTSVEKAARCLWQDELGARLYLAPVPPSGNRQSVRSLIQARSSTILDDLQMEKVFFGVWLVGALQWTGETSPLPVEIERFFATLESQTQDQRLRALECLSRQVGVELPRVLGAYYNQIDPIEETIFSWSSPDDIARAVVARIFKHEKIWFTNVIGMGGEISKIYRWHIDHWQELNPHDFINLASIQNRQPAVVSLARKYAAQLTKYQGPAAEVIRGHVVSLRNGTFDFDSGVFRPVRMEDRCVDPIDLFYLTPDQRMPEAQNRVFQILDAYVPEVRKALLYSLLPRLVAPWAGGKHFYLVGPSGTGKSTFLKLIDRCLDGRVSHLSVADLKDPHRSERFQGLFANLITEETRTSVKKMNDWKDAADGDYIEISPKGKRGLRVKRMVTQIHAANLMPILEFHGDEYFRRMQILPVIVRLLGTTKGNNRISRNIQSLTIHEISSVWSAAADMAAKLGPEEAYPGDADLPTTQALYNAMAEPVRALMQKKMTWSQTGEGIPTYEIVERYLADKLSLQAAGEGKRDPRAKQRLADVVEEVARSMGCVVRRQRTPTVHNGVRTVFGLAWSLEPDVDQQELMSNFIEKPKAYDDSMGSLPEDTTPPPHGPTDSSQGVGEGED